MTGENTAKKDRDPIMSVCLGIFIVAAVIALGCFVVNEYFPTSDTTASTGDTVTVDYVGTYYGEYGSEYAVVFDTNKSSIGDDDDIQKSNDYTEKTSYSGLSFKIGNNTMLEGFEKAVIGHKVGDTFKVALTANQGYVGPNTSGVMKKTDNTVSTVQFASKTDFNELYPDVTLKDNQVVTFESKYGCNAQALYTDSTNAVIITYMPVVGETYEVYKEGDTVVSFKVKSVGETMTFDLIIDNPVQVDSSGSIQMIKLELEQDIYITAIHGDDIVYKTGSERMNQPLYFEITLTKIE